MQIVKRSILLLFIALAASCSQTELPVLSESSDSKPLKTKDDDELTLQEHVVSVNGTPEFNVIVEITGESGDVVIDTTDANGHCTFENLLAGTYTIELSKNGQSATYVETIVEDSTLVHIL